MFGGVNKKILRNDGQRRELHYILDTRLCPKVDVTGRFQSLLSVGVSLLAGGHTAVYHTDGMPSTSRPLEITTSSGMLLTHTV